MPGLRKDWISGEGMTMGISDGAALNRWRLVLGKSAEGEMPLSGARLRRMDDALDFLYSREAGADVRQGGLGASSPSVAHWLSEVRTLFPQETAEVLQRHALDRYQLTELLADREVLEKLEPNQALLETVLSLKHLMKGSVLDTARRIVDKVVAELTKKMEQEVRASALGKLDRSSRSSVRSIRNLDFKRTVRENLAHYDLENRRLMLEKVHFNGRIKRYNPWQVILCIDESGSMMSSVIHSAVMAGIFSKMPMLDTKLVIFDTAVVDLSGFAGDPVQTLMSIQLGGGTDIAGALRYCEGLVANPHRTMVVLVSDLCEGGPRKNLYGVARDILESGAKLIALTALDENAAPAYDRSVGQTLADLGAWVGAMTPAKLADFMANVMRQ